jgi:hypothetical protein
MRGHEEVEVAAYPVTAVFDPYGVERWNRVEFAARMVDDTPSKEPFQSLSATLKD